MQRLNKERKIADKFWYDRAKQEMDDDGVSTIACTDISARSAVTGFTSKTSVRPCSEGYTCLQLILQIVVLLSELSSRMFHWYD